MAKVDDFFFEENSVSELSGDRYAHIEMLKRAVDAMANATYQSIYVIDYFKREFLHVASNPLFLGGHTAEQMKKMGYQFYIEHVPENEQAMLLEINSAGFKKFNKIPFEERDGFFISYDFHIEDGMTAGCGLQCAWCRSHRIVNLATLSYAKKEIRPIGNIHLNSIAG